MYKNISKYHLTNEIAFKRTCNMIPSAIWIRNCLLFCLHWNHHAYRHITFCACKISLYLHFQWCVINKILMWIVCMCVCVLYMLCAVCYVQWTLYLSLHTRTITLNKRIFGYQILFLCGSDVIMYTFKGSVYSTS